MTAYDILGSTPGSTQSQLRRSYLNAIRACHPDRARDGAERRERTARAAALNQAWALLRDPAARRAYDARLGRETPPASSRTSPRATAPPPTSSAAAWSAPPPSGSLCWDRGFGGWAVLLLIFIAAGSVGAELASGSLLLHAANWTFIGALFQVAAARSSSPLAGGARFALARGLTMLRPNGSTDSLRHPWRTTRR